MTFDGTESFSRPMRRPFTVLAMTSAATLALASCVDSRLDPPPPPVRVSATDLYGTWVGWEGSSVSFRTKSQVATVNLDGQEFRFDDAWRMTGTGTWRLLGPDTYRGGNFVGNGSVIHLEVHANADSTEEKASAGGPSPTDLADPGDVASRTERPPEKAAWDLGVTKGKSGELLLFFLTSDPDVRDTYYLTKGSAPASS